MIFIGRNEAAEIDLFLWRLDSISLIILSPPFQMSSYYRKPFLSWSTQSTTLLFKLPLLSSLDYVLHIQICYFSHNTPNLQLLPAIKHFSLLNWQWPCPSIFTTLTFSIWFSLSHKQGPSTLVLPMLFCLYVKTFIMRVLFEVNYTCIYFFNYLIKHY